MLPSHGTPRPLEYEHACVCALFRCYPQRSRLLIHRSNAQVKEYMGLKKPKHHFLTHLSGDVWKYGPPRAFWCFGFEAFNKLIKNTCNLTNYNNEVLAVMQYWSMRSARRLKRARCDS